MKKLLSVLLVAGGLVAVAMPLQASAEPIATSAVKRCGSVGGFGFGSAGGITARNMSSRSRERSPGTSWK